MSAADELVEITWATAQQIRAVDTSLCVGTPTDATLRPRHLMQWCAPRWCRDLVELEMLVERNWSAAVAHLPGAPLRFDFSRVWVAFIAHPELRAAFCMCTEVDVETTVRPWGARDVTARSAWRWLLAHFP